MDGEEEMFECVKMWTDKKWLDLKGKMCEKSEAMGTVEIILIIVCLVGVVLIFKEQITELVEDLFDKITSQAKRV